MNERSRRTMNALEARTLLFQRKLACKEVDWSIPGLPELDNQLAILELGADQTGLAAKLAERPDGTTDNILAMAATVCFALVMRDTKERVFTDRDVEAVASLGASVLKPLGDLVVQASGLAPDALEEAKKNLKPTLVQDLSISSVESLAAVSQ